MGVYINGMTMPKSCFECDLYGDENNFCKAQKEYMPFASFGRDYKDANCPMVEVPEPHGRLIDADAFKTDYRMSDDCDSCDTNWKSCQYDTVYAKMDFCGWLDDAPTVIEAEDEA